MRSEKGSAVALVLLVLGVISLIGVAALLQSRLDLRFATALQSYDKMFNLADGASKLSLEYLRDKNPEAQLDQCPEFNPDNPTHDGEYFLDTCFPQKLVGVLQPADQFSGKLSEVGTWDATAYILYPQVRVKGYGVKQNAGTPYQPVGIGKRPEALGEDAESQIGVGTIRIGPKS
jgi:Tfp pilus assembly protein PilX